MARLKSVRKAIAALVTPVVVFVVVKHLGGDQDTALAIASVITGALVHQLPNG